MIIHAGYDEERKRIIEYSEEEKKKLTDYVKKIENKHGFSDEHHNGINSYDNDDYLFLCELVRAAYDVCTRMNNCPNTRRFREGYNKVPYIHSELTNDFALFDKGLNAGVKKVNDIYWLHFNRYKFEKCILFLQLIFDQNQELLLNLNNQQVRYKIGTIGIATDTFKNEQLVGKNEIMVQALGLKKLGMDDISKNMIQYACSLGEDAKVHMPAIVFVNEGTENQAVDVIYYDDERQALSVPLKKKIFNTSGFHKWFIRRNELIQRVFEESMQFVISHEFAHIANGHCDLKNSDTQYCNRREIALCAELNADDTAVRWRIFDLLSHRIVEDLQSQFLIYTREELKEEWVIRGFSAYFALSWCYREDERKWTLGTLEKFIRDEKATHPIYQFRTFSILNRVLCCLDEVIHTKNFVELKTRDKAFIDEKLIVETKNDLMDMVYSFEKYFDETYNDNRLMLEWIKESGKVEDGSIPDDYHKVPFLMPVYLKRANEEMKKMVEPWAELKEKLEDNGTYCKLYQI